MSKSYVVLTAVGPDRPGLVDILGAYIFERGGNVESSRMATLGGEFAIVMLVGGEPAATRAIENDADTLIHEAKLICHVRPTTDPDQHRPAVPSMPFHLVATSMDHPGIVRAIAHHLAQRGVNIETLDTAVEQAPHTGTSLFRMSARVGLPAEVNVPKFRSELNALAESLNVDLQFTACED